MQYRPPNTYHEVSNTNNFGSVSDSLGRRALSSSSLGSHRVPLLGEGISMPSASQPVLLCPLPDRVPSRRSFLQRLTCHRCRIFCHMVSMGDTRGPSVLFEAVDVHYPGPLNFLSLLSCPLTDPDMGPSIPVCDVEHTSFHFSLCGSIHSWQHTVVVHLSLQADGNVAFEDIPVFGVCRPAACLP